MPWACRRFAVVFFVFGLLLVSGKVAHTQDQSITSSTSMGRPKVIPRPCGDGRPVPGPQRKSGSVRETDRSDKLCAELAFDRSATASLGHGDVREKANEDAVLEELIAMGEQGLVIERARQEVLEILEGQNRCAAWFQQAEPEVARKFQSLRYRIDESGPPYTFKLQNASGEWLYQQPYVAKVTALLHEFSHVVGLLPADGGTVFGSELSTQNTQIVLRHCRAEVEAAGKHKGLFLNPGTGSFHVARGDKSTF